MNTIKSITLLFLLTSLFFAACDKENIDDLQVGDPNYQPDTVVVNTLMSAVRPNSMDGLDMDCISIEFPFDVQLESGATLTIQNKDDFEAATGSQAQDRAVDFVFPINVWDEDGNLMQMNSNAELGTSFASCIPGQGWSNAMITNDVIPAFLFEGLCFDLSFPVDLEDENGNSYVANNQSELIDYCATIEPLFFDLPVTVVDEDGADISIEDLETFFELSSACFDAFPPVTGDGIVIQGFGCHTLIYPIQVTDANGNIITVNDADEYANLVLNGEELELLYPFTLESIVDGQQYVINNIDDMIDALEACGIDIDISDPGDCGFAQAHVILFYNALNIFTLNNYPYDINYPVTLIVEGDPVVINNDDEYLPAVGGSPSNILQADFVYPISITQFGREIELNSDDEVCEFYRTLLEPCENKPAHIQFFFNGGPGTPSDCAYYISYPLEITLNGSTIQVRDRDDYLDELNTNPNAYDDIELVYPVSATQYESGQQVTFASGEDICEYQNNCQ